MTSSFASLPFPAQRDRIAQLARRDAALPALFDDLAALPDHEPLACALRVLDRAGHLERAAPHLQRHLTRLPDTGIQRALRALEGVDLSAHPALTGALLHARTHLPVARIAAICLLDRWLKNAAPGVRDEVVRDATRAAEAATRAGPEAIRDLPDAHLVSLPGRSYAGLEERAEERGVSDAWAERTRAFAERVLATLQSAPRSLSQANAEDILARRVYTDPGHFLVELLQNAEDAGASRCVIHIDEDAVRVWHDGAPFDARDVVGVLSIGQTTKAREQIGFFGVGFKSVYEIAERPRLDSGLFCFEIADVSIPRALAPEPRPAGIPEGGTLLTLPYRDGLDSRRTPDALYRYATHGVPPETLLTLRNLHTLSLRSGARHREVRCERGERHAELHVLTHERSAVQRWRTLQRTFRYEGGEREQHKARATRVLVALPIEDGAPTPLPPDAPTLFSHLPTRERSGLRFLTHAHFDVPVDRERLDLDAPWNLWALACAGELLATHLQEIADEDDDDTLIAALRLLPLERELAHPAFTHLTRRLTDTLAHAPVLPAADTQTRRLTPTQAALLEDPALVPVLRDVTLPHERHAAPHLDARLQALLRQLGASTLSRDDTARLLERTLRDTSDGDAWPTPWLRERHLDLLDALGDDAWTPLDARLCRLPLLPDQDGAPHRPGALARTTPELRALYGPLHRHLHPDLDDHPTPPVARLLERLELPLRDDATLVRELRDPHLADRLLERAGPTALHRHLAQLPPRLLAGLEGLPLFPTTDGPRLPLRGEARAVVCSEPELRRLLDATRGARPPRVDDPLTDDLLPYLLGLGATHFDLDHTLDALDRGELAPVDADDARPLHDLLAQRADHLGPRALTRLRRLTIFPDTHGALRSLTGDEPALLPAWPEMIPLAPDAPWLDATLRDAPHITRMNLEPIGGEALVDALLLEDHLDLLDPFDPESLARATQLLLHHPPSLSSERARALARAPVWLSHADTAHPLDTLALPPRAPRLDALYRDWPRHPLIHEDDPAYQLARRLDLHAHIQRLDLDTLTRDLIDAHSSDGGGLEEALTTRILDLLEGAPERLGSQSLARLRALPLFPDTEGHRRPLGDWDEPEPERVYRAHPPLRALLSGEPWPLTHPDLEARLPRLLDALAPAATWSDALRHIDPDKPERAQRLRRHLLDAPPESLEPLTDRLSTLPLWPAVDGSLQPAAALTRPTALERTLGDAWRELGADHALLDPSWDARALPPLNFREPTTLVRAHVEAHARPDAPLDDQPPSLRTRAQLARIGRCLAYAADLPLALDARAHLVAGPLLRASEDALTLAAGGPLEPRLADPRWAELVSAERPLETLPPRHLLDALLEEAREALPSSEHPRFESAEARAALYRWLLDHAADIEADENARGRLRNAHLFPTRAGVLQRPEALIPSPHLEALAEELGLLERCPHPELPDALLAWLRDLFDMQSGELTGLMNALLDAHRDARSSGDGARSARLMSAIEDTLTSAADDDGDDLHALVERFKLRKLKVQASDGRFDHPRKLLLLDDEAAALLARFLPEPPRRVHTHYANAHRVLEAAGAPTHLDDDALRGALDRAPTGDAAIALARYVAERLDAEPGLIERLGLRERAWLPDSGGAPRRPDALTWPSPEVEALIGAPPERTPHPELVITAPASLRERLPFTPIDALGIEAVTAHAEAQGGLRDVALTWLERGLREGRLDADATRSALDRPLFPADDGTLRTPDALCCDPDTHLLCGRIRATWSDGLTYSKLSSTLGIPPHITPDFLRDTLAEITARLRDEPALAEAHPELERALPRLIAWLAHSDARPLSPVALVAYATPEEPSRLLLSDHPEVALPQPASLAQVARHLTDGPLLALVLDDRGGAVTRWLRACGLADLEAHVRPAPLPRALPGDISNSIRDRLDALRERIGQVLLALTELVGADAVAPPARIHLHLVRQLEREGFLGGERVSWQAEFAAERSDDTLRIVFTPHTSCDHDLVAEHLLRHTLSAPERARWFELTRDLLGAPDMATFVALKQGRTEPTPEPEARPEPGPSRDASASEPPPEEEDDDEKPGLWGRLKRWWRSDEASEEEPRRRREPPSPVPTQAHAQRDWFRPQESVSSQLHDATAWVQGRYQRPDFGFAFAPAKLPRPWLYGHRTLASHFDKRAQRWSAIDTPPEWWRAAGEGAHEIALRGELPRGEVQLPMPGYSRLLELNLSCDFRRVRARSGAHVLFLEDDGVIEARLALDPPPAHTDAPALQSGAVPESLLSPTAADSELPDEVHAFLDSLLADGEPLVERADAVVDFIRGRYRYDPTYLEDPAVARWLSNVSRGRDNAHLAALHAGRDARHLGRGVCYELGVLAVEMLRRVEIPAAITTGWTFDRGLIDAPDHLWACALLPTEAGPRWWPLDASSTRDGRPLHAAQRPAGPWRVSPPPQPPPPADDDDADDDTPRRWDRGAHRPSTPQPSRPQGRSQSRKRERSRRRHRPLRELVQVLRYLERSTGSELADDHAALLNLAKVLLEDPDALREKLDP